MAAVGDWLGRLTRLAESTPSVQALYTVDRPGGLVTGLDLWVVAGADLLPRLRTFLQSAGDAAYLALTASGAVVVTADGVEVHVALSRCAPELADQRWRVLFRREIPSVKDDTTERLDAQALNGVTTGLGAGESRAHGGATLPASNDGDHISDRSSQPPDLAGAASGFWYHLYRAATEIGRQHPFGAHSDLEHCRKALLDLYRMALAPGAVGRGWEHVDELPGAAKALAGLAEWLVCPLEVTALWRCAHRLGAAYESLVLPLLDRLGVVYPWAMRNLTFQLLDQVRPGRAPVPTASPAHYGAQVPPPQGGQAQPSATSAGASSAGGPTRYKVRRRRPEATE